MIVWHEDHTSLDAGLLDLYAEQLSIFREYARRGQSLPNVSRLVAHSFLMSRMSRLIVSGRTLSRRAISFFCIFLSTMTLYSRLSFGFAISGDLVRLCGGFASASIGEVIRFSGHCVSPFNRLRYS